MVVNFIKSNSIYTWAQRTSGSKFTGTIIATLCFISCWWRWSRVSHESYWKKIKIEHIRYKQVKISIICNKIGRKARHKLLQRLPPESKLYAKPAGDQIVFTKTRAGPRCTLVPQHSHPLWNSRRPARARLRHREFAEYAVKSCALPYAKPRRAHPSTSWAKSPLDLAAHPAWRAATHTETPGWPVLAKDTCKR